MEADFPACEIAPSAAVYKLAGIKQSKQQKLCKRRIAYATAARTKPASLCPTAAANGPHCVLRTQSNWGFNTLVSLGKHIPSCTTAKDKTMTTCLRGWMSFNPLPPLQGCKQYLKTFRGFPQLLGLSSRLFRIYSPHLPTCVF